MDLGPADTLDSDNPGDSGAGVPVLHVSDPDGVDHPAIPVGPTQAMTEDDWLDVGNFHGGDHSLIEYLKKITPGITYEAREETRLEDGTLLQHHSEEECSGNCCLHGISLYESCNRPRAWNATRKQIQHVCPCEADHPCVAGVAYAQSKGRDPQAEHACCGIEGHCTTDVGIPRQRPVPAGEIIWPEEKTVQLPSELDEIRIDITVLKAHAEAARVALRHLDDTGGDMFVKAFETLDKHNYLLGKLLKFTGEDSAAIAELRRDVERLKVRSWVLFALAVGGYVACVSMAIFVGMHWPK